MSRMTLDQDLRTIAAADQRFHIVYDGCFSENK